MKDYYCLGQHRFKNEDTYKFCRGCGQQGRGNYYCQSYHWLLTMGYMKEKEAFMLLGQQDQRRQKLTRILR